VADELDYYQILGVERAATADELKRAFRLQAVRLHPDTNPDADAKLRFEELREAYSVLSDLTRRDFYDRHGVADLGPDEARPEEALDDLFRPGSDVAKLAPAGITSPACRHVVLTVKRPATAGLSGEHADLSYERVVGCTECEGHGGTPLRNCERCGATGRVELRVGLRAAQVRCPACAGRRHLPEVMCVACNGRGTRRHRVRVPAPAAATARPQVVRVEAAGDELPAQSTGDLFLVLEGDEDAL